MKEGEAGREGETRSDEGVIGESRRNRETVRVNVKKTCSASKKRE